MGLKVAIANVINSAINGFRIIKAEIYPKYSKQTRAMFPPGIDSAPVDGIDQALIIEVGTSGKTAYIGSIPGALVDKGEIRIYSRDENGDLKASVHCKQNGDIEIISTGTGKIAIDNDTEKLKKIMNDLIQEIKAIVTTGPHTVSAGSQTLLEAVNVRVNNLLKES